ncbi:MAG: hypothetical protein GIW99_03790 [Candidatus Eremiobacteraeota bacterium]|nr:hypothetical protein [Candidatus Eremiobacteraeota bacterium]
MALSFIAINTNAITAQAAPKMSSMQSGSMPKPGWELGTWSCSSHMMAMGAMPARNMTTTMTMKMNEMKWVDITSSANGRMMFMGHMSGRPNGVFTGIDSMGNGYMQTMGPMMGNRMSMSGTMNGPHGNMRVRDTVTRYSDSKMRHESFAMMQGGWKRTAYDDCTKQM